MKHYGVDNIIFGNYLIIIKNVQNYAQKHMLFICKNVDLLFFEIWESDMNKLNDGELSIYIINLLKNIKNDT